MALVVDVLLHGTVGIMMSSAKRLLLGVWLAAAALAMPSVVTAAERLVTLGGTVTEIVFALGAGDQVVATDASSLYPPQVVDLPRVGYYRSVPVEGVLSVKPDRVLASENAGPAAALTRIAELGVRVDRLTDKPALKSLYERIQGIAKALDRSQQADALIEKIDRDLALVTQAPQAPLRAVVLLNRTGSYMAAGEGTAAAAVLELAGLRNAMSAGKGYKPLSIEGLVALDPDVIVLTSATATAVGGLEAFLQQPAVKATSAAAAGRIGAVDDLLILGIGPRVAQAVRQLREMAQ
nr:MULTISPECIES: helical backbone metal receptor [unclassified Pusillimonas]